MKFRLRPLEVMNNWAIQRAQQDYNLQSADSLRARERLDASEQRLTAFYVAASAAQRPAASLDVLRVQFLNGQLEGELRARDQRGKALTIAEEHLQKTRLLMAELRGKRETLRRCRSKVLRDQRLVMDKKEMWRQDELWLARR